MPASGTSVVTKIKKEQKDKSISEGKKAKKLPLKERPLYQQFSTASMKRLSLRAGIPSCQTDIKTEHSKRIALGWLRRVVTDAVVYTQNAGRKTVMVEDIRMALSKNNFSYISYMGVST